MDEETAERVYSMIVGFSGFGFPKAHGAAFGLLAYQSTWLRVHYGPEFLCALLNEQPMGFYASDTLVHEAQRRGIELLPADVNESAAECTVRQGGRRGRRGPGGARLRLGVRGDEVAALVATREEGGRFRSLADLASRAGAGRPSLEKLAWAGACDPLAGIDLSDAAAAGRARRAALWQLGVAAPGDELPDGTQLALPLDVPAPPRLRKLEPWEAMVADYATTGLTLGRHPMALLRGGLPAGTVTAATWRRCATRRRCASAASSSPASGPGTAKGIVFLLLEDEYGTINLIVPPDVYERHRLTVRTEPLVIARGRLEKLPQAGGALNVYVKHLEPLVTPDEDVAGVVELAERGAAAAAVEAPARGRREAADPSATAGGLPRRRSRRAELRVREAAVSRAAPRTSSLRAQCRRLSSSSSGSASASGCS